MPDNSRIDALAAVAGRLATGGGPPAVGRAVGSALRCSAVLRDASGSTLALVARSTLEERSLRSRENLEVHDLTVGGRSVGTFALAWHDAPAPSGELDIALAILAAAVAVADEHAGSDVAEQARLLTELLAVQGQPDDELLARVAEVDGPSQPRSVLIVRALPVTTLEEGWRADLLDAVGAAAAESESRSVVVQVDLPRVGAVPAIIAPGVEAAAGRIATQVAKRLEPHATKFRTTVGVSRAAATTAELVRARDEALLAANVALAEGDSILAFEETGSYRLLLPVMTTDIAELERFYDETVSPLMAYDRQYETELVRTVEAFLENDGNIAGTAQALFTHRHTVRYRLERVRELAGLDVGSSDGRERLSLGLKAMRVLGIGRQTGGHRGAAPPRLRTSSR